MLFSPTRLVNQPIRHVSIRHGVGMGIQAVGTGVTPHENSTSVKFLFFYDVNNYMLSASRSW
jgi:hypothetical protein